MNENGIKKALKIIIITIAVLLMAGAVAAVLFLVRWTKVNPNGYISLAEASYVSRDAGGNVFVIGGSGTDMYKLSPEGELLWRDTAYAKDFTSPAKVIADGEGDVYVHDVEIAGGVRIGSESIIKFSPEGKDRSVIKTLNAPEGTVRQMIIGIIPMDRGVLYAVKSEDVITLYSSETDTPVAFYGIEGAESGVLSCAYDVREERFYYSTYNGRIMEFREDGDDILLYSSDSQEGSIPQYLSYFDGFLYCNDIGLRDIIKLDTETKDVLRLSVGGEINERYIDTSLCAVNHLVSVSDVGITLWNEDGTFETYYEAALSPEARGLCIMFWVAAIYCILFLAAVVMLLIHAIIKKTSMFTKVAMAVAMMVALLSLLFTVTLFPELRTQVTEEIYSREMLAANVINNSLPVDAFLRLDKPSDFMGEDYMAVRQAVRNVFFTDTDDAKDLYCVLYRVIDGTITLTYTMEDICVVYPYDWEYEESDFQSVIEGGETLTFASSSSAGSFVYVDAPLYDKDGNIQGMMEIGTDMNSVTERNNKMLISLLINVLAIMVVAYMFVIEFIYYIKGHREYIEQDCPVYQKKIPVEIFRFVVFLIFFITNLTCAILPIYSMKLASEMPSTGISPVMMAAIPISVEVVSGAVFSALGGKVIKALGTGKSIVLSSLLITVGLGLRALPSIVALIVGGTLLGAGWGVMLILVNVLIAALPEEEKDRGYAYYSVSALSGANCAAVFGGFLIQWMSYWMLFALTAVLSVTLFIVCRKYLVHELPQEEEIEEEQSTGVSMFRFIFDPSVLSFFLFIMVPILICGYFLNYLFPILGSDLGLSDTYISYAYILSGSVVLITGTKLSDVMSARKIKNLGLFLSIVFFGLAFTLVAFTQNIPGLIGAVVILGIAESFAIMLPAYFTDLPIVEKFGFDKALGLYSLVENAAQSLGSFVFGLVFVIGLDRGLLAVTGLIGVLAVLFLICSLIWGRRKKEEPVAYEE